MQQIVEYIINTTITVITPIVFGYIVIDRNFHRLKIKRKLIAFFVVLGLSLYIYEFSPSVSKTILSFLIHVFEYKQFFKFSYSKAIFISFIYILILMVLDIFQLLFFVNILGMNKEYCYSYFAGSIISNVIVCFNTCALAYVLKNKLKQLFNAKVENSNNVLYMALFTILCVIILFFDIISNYKDNNNIFSYIMLIIIFLIVISNLIKEKIVINDKIKEYNSLLAFMRTYEMEIESNRIQNHEIKNQFITIISMLKDNEKKDKILNYVSNLVKDYKNIDDNKYSDLQYLPLNGLKGFICNKINKAESENINVSVIIEKGIQNSIIANLKTDEFKKLGILLGVYLDNAIEATAVTADKSLSIEMYIQNGDVLIIISNTFNNEIIYDNDSNKFKTTKGVGHGYGLQLVSKVLNNSKKFIVSNYMQSNVFIQRIIVKK